MKVDSLFETKNANSWKTVFQREPVYDPRYMDHQNRAMVADKIEDLVTDHHRTGVPIPGY